MYTIDKSSSVEIEINKSRFIGILIPVRSIDEVRNSISLLRNEYKDASHYCYAYIINDKCKSSDDKEPGGTAGVPIMEVLIKNDFNYSLLVVIRYFGGIKLGAGGLVRAYTKTASLVVKNCTRLLITKGFKVGVLIPYSEKEKFSRIVNNSVCNYEYGLDINCMVLCNEEVKEKICLCYSPYLIEKTEILK